MPPDRVYPLTSYSSLSVDSEDLVQMDDINEPMINHNLRRRFMEDNIYTAIGTILVSVNPYRQVPLYTPRMIEK